jgi:3-oxo-5-alpha-steroid 4-dehydrogenase 1
VIAATSDSSFDLPLTIAFAIVALTAISAPFVATPYGRFASERFGAALDPRLGWMLMELPASVVFFATFFRGPNWDRPFPLFFLFVWSCHYLNRGFLMPLFMRVPAGQKNSFSLVVIAIGWCVTSLHGYLNAAWVTRFAPNVGWSWFADPRFIVGVTLYYAGLIGNLHADHVLRTLRTKDEVARGERHYRIPHGGLFELVTNASYFAELVLWAGLAIFSWSPAGVFIFAISCANLVPRAIATHRWYNEKFADYPTTRRVLIPYVW